MTPLFKAPIVESSSLYLLVSMARPPIDGLRTEAGVRSPLSIFRRQRPITERAIDA